MHFWREDAVKAGKSKCIPILLVFESELHKATQGGTVCRALMDSNAHAGYTDPVVASSGMVGFRIKLLVPSFVNKTSTSASPDAARIP